MPTLLVHLVLLVKSHVVDGLRQAKMTMTKVAQFSTIHSRVEHKQLNPGVYGVERVCSTKVLSFFKYQSDNMKSSMEQEVPKGGEQKSDVSCCC
uniref:Secreted protein n=1 Tax=Triticum urartu TaxID=4572 RepID=A0A8R7QD43_TRIUA